MKIILVAFFALVSTVLCAQTYDYYDNLGQGIRVENGLITGLVCYDSYKAPRFTAIAKGGKIAKDKNELHMDVELSADAKKLTIKDVDDVERFKINDNNEVVVTRKVSTETNFEKLKEDGVPLYDGFGRDGLNISVRLGADNKAYYRGPSKFNDYEVVEEKWQELAKATYNDTTGVLTGTYTNKEQGTTALIASVIKKGKNGSGNAITFLVTALITGIKTTKVDASTNSLAPTYYIDYHGLVNGLDVGVRINYALVTSIGYIDTSKDQGVIFYKDGKLLEFVPLEGYKKKELSYGSVKNEGGHVSFSTSTTNDAHGAKTAEYVSDFYYDKNGMIKAGLSGTLSFQVTAEQIQTGFDPGEGPKIQFDLAKAFTDTCDRSQSSWGVVDYEYKYSKSDGKLTGSCYIRDEDDKLAMGESIELEAIPSKTQTFPLTVKFSYKNIKLEETKGYN